LSFQEIFVRNIPLDAPKRASLYPTIWRWHFYAGLFVIPFILILSLTGAIYLFKPQIDRWEERDFQGLSVQGAVSPNAQLAAALAAHPGAQFHSYRLPEAKSDAALVHLALADGHSMRDVYVSPQGKVLASRDPNDRISKTVSRIHGSLLLGKIGDWIVELAACWAMVMILTGLYLWWPVSRGFAGVVWPRLRSGSRAFWRDLHAVTGFWVAGFAFVLLSTGLPWSNVWGDVFQMARTELGLVKGKSGWSTAEQHAEHDHEAMLRQQAAGIPMAALADIVAVARKEEMAFPSFVRPPGIADRFGPDSSKMVWTIAMETQNRPQNRKLEVDAATGKLLRRTGFADKHPIDKAIGYGIAWHEGQLFGWINQLVGVLTALALITLSISGFVMWRRRKPEAMLGVPPVPREPAKLKGVVAIILLLAALLPLLALSLILLWLFDRFLLPRLPQLAHWLGAGRVQPE
jgi:uncharacterized iron-regulated membrane protein